MSDAAHDELAGDGHGDAPPPGPGVRQRARRLYVRVLAVQALTLLALWLLQAFYGTG